MADITYAKDLRPGMTFLINDDIFLVLENTFNKTCQSKPVIKVRCRNLRKDNVSWITLDQEKYNRAEVNNVKMSFSYIDGKNYVFMDSVTFESLEMPENKLDWEKNFLTEGLEISVIKYGDEVLGINLPDQVVMKIKEAEDAVQGNTVNNVQKRA
jgi:elongation factor P